MNSGRAIIVLAVGLLLCLAACTDPPTTDSDPGTYADAIVAETNRVRQQQGLDPLARSACATSQALDRATALLGRDELTHAPMDEVFDACPPYSAAAENLVDSAAGPDEVVAAWMDSPGHRANLLDPDLTEVGVGCVVHEDELLCSQVFLGQG